MIGQLKPYLAYKDSGLPWLGQVPEHWEIARSKRLFWERKEFAKADAQQLSATQAYGVIPQALYEERSGYRVVKISMHLDKRRHVERGDFVISMRSFEGGLERAWASGAIRSSYCVLRRSSAAHPGYFRYFFKSVPYISALRATANFIRDGQDLNFNNFAAVPLLLIPLKEQAAIARFLDCANEQLERAIRAKRKVIALLNEQKQAIIHRAVTRGLDPNVPFRPSGISWLGDIPQHWEVRKLKHLTRFVNGLPFKPGDWKAVGVPIIRIQNLNGSEVFNYTDKTDLPDELLIQPGDLMFAWSGNRGTSFGSFEWTREFPGYLNQHIFKLVGYTLPKRYFYYLLRAVTRHVEEQAGGIIGLVHVTKPELGSVHVPIAPADEAEAIARDIDRATAGVGRTISRLEREIELLREYRTRLIADVVTGKLDVREAAARLPDEAAPDVAEDDAEIAEELDSEAEDAAA